jgi:M6 family metalloprotease-like protein
VVFITPFLLEKNMVKIFSVLIFILQKFLFLPRNFNRMKKIIFILFWSLLFMPMTYAAYFENVPQTRVQPNGDTLHCFATGDEYFHRLHDADGYTIVLDPATGYYVYADKVSDELVPTTYVAGRTNPAEVGLTPGLSISAQQWYARRARWNEPSRERATTRDGEYNHGHINNVVIFIRFADDDDFTNSFYDVNRMFNDSTVGYSSMNNYFKAATYNQLTITSSFYPVPEGNTILSYQDIYDRSYFEPYSSANPNGYGDGEQADREHQLLARAVEAVADQIPEDLDIDYDDDGYVDNVVFVVRGNVGNWNDLLWPHRWALYAASAYIHEKRVWDFNLQLADASSYFNTSVLCHEMNHTLGAPDLYHYYEGTELTAVHTWDLMHQNTNPPQHMGAYMKYRYGNWIDDIPEITECGTYTLHSLGSSATNNCYKIASPNENEFFVLEYRNLTDPFEGTLPSSGLLVYRINTDFYGNASYNGVDVFDEVYIFRPGGTTTENGNIYQAALGADLGRTEMNTSTNPYPFLTDGTIVGASVFSIQDVSATGDETITFTFCPLSISVITSDVSNITTTSATCGGTVEVDDGVEVLSRGVCWSTSPNPSIADNFTVDGNGVGSFSSTLTGLAPATMYYVRAYATYDGGTAYGAETDFATECEVIVVTEDTPYHEGFEYFGICWDVEQVAGSAGWQLDTEGNAIEGSVCARAPYTPGAQSVLISPVLDLSQMATPKLTFQHLQAAWNDLVDALAVYYRTADNTPWQMLAEYTEAYSSYTTEIIPLPEPSATYQLAFLATGNDGWYVFLDDINIIPGCELAGASIIGDTEFCEGGSTTLTAQGGQDYLWNTGSTEASILVTEAGTYEVMASDEHGCTQTVETVVVMWNAASSEFTIVTDEPSYTWNGESYVISGDYSQTLTTVHGCDSIVTLHLTITAGVGEWNGSTFNIYPNPTTSILNVEWSMGNVNADAAEIQLLDVYGRLLDVVKANCGTTQIDLSAYAKGVYFVQLVADGQVVGVRKVVRQ